MLDEAKDDFLFHKKDIVLAKYGSEVFYAKIIDIDYKKKLAKLLFDDGSKDKIQFERICSVNETTSDIICVICKKDSSDTDNDIVLCDECNVGFHQNCHDPIISSDVLTPEVPWKCSYCSKKIKNPHVESNPFERRKCSQQQPSNLREKCDFEDNADEFTSPWSPKELTVKIEKLDAQDLTGTTNCVLEESQLKSENGMIDDKDGKESYEVPNLNGANKNIIDFVEENKLSPDSIHEQQEDPHKSEISTKHLDEYGKQVVIAHADSTSKLDEEEDIIVDVENDNDVQVLPIAEASIDRIKSDGLLRIYKEGQERPCETSHPCTIYSSQVPHSLRFRPYSKPNVTYRSLITTAMDTKSLRNVALKRYLSRKYASCNNEMFLPATSFHPMPAEKSQLRQNFEYAFRINCNRMTTRDTGYLQNSPFQYRNLLQGMTYSKEVIEKCLKNVQYSTDSRVKKESGKCDGTMLVDSSPHKPNTRCVDRNFINSHGSELKNLHNTNQLNRHPENPYFLPTKDMRCHNTAYATDQTPCQPKQQQNHEEVKSLVLQSKQRCSTKVCPCCGKYANLLCSGCQNVRYCSKKCQIEDWRLHAYRCKMFDGVRTQHVKLSGNLQN